MNLCKIRLIGNKWGGYAPRKRGWYETADKGNGDFVGEQIDQFSI
jgi:hypothetical protein